MSEGIRSALHRLLGGRIGAIVIWQASTPTTRIFQAESYPLQQGCLARRLSAAENIEAGAELVFVPSSFGWRHRQRDEHARQLRED